MKRKFSIGWLLLSLIFVIGAVGFSSCNNDDDDLKDKVYEGYIEQLGQDIITIKVTYSPYKATEYNEMGEPMPLKNDFLEVKYGAGVDSDLKEGQKISFRVISPRMFAIVWPMHRDYFIWECEVEILKYN